MTERLEVPQKRFMRRLDDAIGLAVDHSMYLFFSREQKGGIGVTKDLQYVPDDAVVIEIGRRFETKAEKEDRAPAPEQAVLPIDTEIDETAFKAVVSATPDPVDAATQSQWRQIIERYLIERARR